MGTNRRQFIWSTGLATSAALLCRQSRDEFASALAPQDGSPSTFYDQDGLIVHKGLDGGDTAQREGWYWFGVWIRQQLLRDPWTVPRKLAFTEVIQLLEPAKNGVFYRHPKLAPWNNPYDKQFGFSRDQMVPLIAAMGVRGPQDPTAGWNEQDPLIRLWNALPQDAVGGTKHTFNGEWTPSKNLPIYYTGDIVGPAAINLYRRALKQNPTTADDNNGPGGEQELSVNVGLRLAATLNDRDNTGDDLNLIVMLLMATLFFPSAVSTEAANTYAKNRAVSYGSFLGAYYQNYPFQPGISADLMKRRIDEGIANGWKTDASRVYGAVRWYHRAEAGANPRLAELYRPIIRAYLE